MFGQISLNLSLALYVVLAMAQLQHNLRKHEVIHLSLGFHSLLFIAATADLYYGFGYIHEWQYWAVSLAMFAFLLVQHIQLLLTKQHVIALGLLSLLILCMLLGLALPRSADVSLAMGWVERVAYWFYAFPQILKNRQNPNAAQSISPVFAIAGLLAAMCDVVSSLYFSWGSPGLYGGIVAVILQAYLLWQCTISRRRSPHD